MQWLLVILGLEFPAVLALIDCINRPPEHFLDGAEDRRSWIRWLLVAVATAWLLVGNGILLGYYYTVVKRNTPQLP